MIRHAFICTTWVWQLPVKGAHVVMTPSRDHLLVAGSEDIAALAAMGAIAKGILEEAPRPMHGRAVVLRGQEWEPFLPPEGTPAYVDFRFLDLMATAGDYDEQKQLLEALHAKEGTDVFVATLSVMQQKGTGEYSSFSSWIDGIETLLPLSDRFALLADEGKKVHGLFAREKVERAAGNLLEKTGDEPPRYRVKGFPTAAQIAQMGPDLGGGRVVSMSLASTSSTTTRSGRIREEGMSRWTGCRRPSRAARSRAGSGSAGCSGTTTGGRRDIVRASRI